MEIEAVSRVPTAHRAPTARRALEQLLSESPLPQRPQMMNRIVAKLMKQSMLESAKDDLEECVICNHIVKYIWAYKVSIMRRKACSKRI